MEEKITFRFLREIQKKERESNELQKLPDDFLEKVKEYIARKRALLENPEMLTFTQRREIENIKPVVRYILDRREQKVVIAAMRSARTGIKPRNLLPHEEELFNRLRETIGKNRCVVEELINMLDGRPVIEGKKKKKNEESDFKKTPESEISEEENKKESNDELKGRVTVSEEIKIEMLKDVPAFVGIDLNKYGPWKKGDVLSVPEKIAQALIKTGRAREVK